MVFHRVDACDMRKHDRALGNAQFEPHRVAHGGIGPELVDVHAVGDDLRPPRAIAQRQVGLETRNRIGRHQIRPSREQRAGLYHEAQTEAHSCADPWPSSGCSKRDASLAPPRHDQRDQRCKVAMIHPALHDVGPLLGDEAGELDQPRGNARGLVEFELHDVYACAAQSRG